MFSCGLASIMTSSNGNIFRVTGHLCGEFTGPRWIPRTKARDAELAVFFDLRLNKRLSKQSWGWWFERPSHPLWRHRNVNLLWSHLSGSFHWSCDNTVVARVQSHWSNPKEYGWMNHKHPADLVYKHNKRNHDNPCVNFMAGVMHPPWANFITTTKQLIPVKTLCICLDGVWIFIVEIRQ